MTLSQQLKNLINTNMSKKVIWNNDISSINSFFKYMVLLWREKGKYEQTYEQKELYDEYVDYCLAVDLDYFSVQTFQRVMSSLGLDSKVVWDEVAMKARRIRTLHLDSLLSLVQGYQDDFYVDSKIINLGGINYLLTTKLKRVTIPEEQQPIENFSNIINNNIINNNYGKPTTTDEQQPSSSDAGGDSCEA